MKNYWCYFVVERTLREYVSIGALIVLSLVTVFLLRTTTPTGYISFDPLTNQSFTTPDFSLSCTAHASQALDNLTISLTDETGTITTRTESVTQSSATATMDFSDMYNSRYTGVCTACSQGLCEQAAAFSLTVAYTVTTPQDTPVINLTFDDETNPWHDYSNLNHQFTKTGAATWADQDVCKWYGCADFSATSADYLSSLTKFTTDAGLAVSFWIYHTVEPAGSNSQAYYQIGQDSNLKWTEQGDYGYSTKWVGQAGEAAHDIGSSQGSAADIWEHVFITYQSGTLTTYLNGEQVLQTSEPVGTLNSALNDTLYIGRGLYGIDTHGFLDEFVVWNRGNFSASEVRARYDFKRSGTPPALDLYIKNVTYELPYDWSSPKNDLDLSGNLPITITIANAGTLNSAGSFVTELNLDGQTVCTHTDTLSQNEEKSFVCNWPKSAGWHSGTVVIDAADDVDETAYSGGDETNNVATLIIPLESHPRLRFSQDQWDNVLEPWFTDSSHEIGYNAYSSFKTFLSEDYNPSWSAGNVDPRAKKGYENALGCYLNDFADGEQCTRARNHLDGWLTQATGWEDASVQALHEVVHVAATYDLLFPTFTQSEAELYSQRLLDICLAIYGKSNVVPHTDAQVPTPGNGKGFGTGMAMACYAVIGDVQSNPNVNWPDPQSYNDKNTIYWWNKRIENHLQGFKDDPEGVYPEGMLYHWYSKYHLVDALWFLKRTNISSIPHDYQNAICSFAKEAARNLLDYNYDGRVLRGDESHLWRQVSFGDTNSYEIVGSDGVHGWDVISVYGLLCDDPEVKQAARTLRYYGYSSGEQTRGAGGLYYYPLLANEVSLTTSITLPRYSFSTSFDRFTLRRSYTYRNDSVFIVDAGDEAGGGHPNAEFDLFAYVFGEPFLDYPQVPYEDDVRSEVWHNTISFTQSTATGYNTDAYDAELNQYYGGYDLTGSYPNFNYLPDVTRGDVEDVVATSDGSFAGLYSWRPYTETTEPVKRYYVIFDNLLAQLDVVKRTSSGTIYDNWLNIYDEFTPTITGNNLTFNRAGTNKYYKIIPVWSSAGAITLTGGESATPYCFAKTSCSGSLGNYGHYTHAVTGQTATTLFAHHWYLNSPTLQPKRYHGTDEGVMAGTSLIVFDTNEDGTITEEGVTSDGWAIAKKGLLVAGLGATTLSVNGQTLMDSSASASVFIDRSTPGFLNISAGSESATTYAFDLDGAPSASVKVDGSAISPSSYAGGMVHFTLAAGIHQIEITTTGDAAPVVVQNQPESFFLSIGSDVSFNCSATDDHSLISLQLLTNTSGSLGETYALTQNAVSLTFSETIAFANGTYSWACAATDDAQQMTQTATKTFTVGGVSGGQAPVVSLVTPSDQENRSNPVSFTCSATDSDSDLSLFSLYTNASGTWTALATQAASGSLDTLQTTQTLDQGDYLWSCKAQDASGHVTYGSNLTFKVTSSDVAPTATLFDGATTDFGSLETFENVTDIILERENLGKVIFRGIISSIAAIDFDQAIDIDETQISVNSSLYPALNVTAELHFYNIPYLNPALLKDQNPCEDVCTNLTYENNTFSFTVLHFTTFRIIDNGVVNVTNTTNTTNETSSPSTGSSSTSSGSSGGGSHSGSSGSAYLPPPESASVDDSDSPAPKDTPSPAKDNPPLISPPNIQTIGSPLTEQPKSSQEEESSPFIPIISLGVVAALLFIGVMFWRRPPKLLPAHRKAIVRATRHAVHVVRETPKRALSAIIRLKDDFVTGTQVPPAQISSIIADEARDVLAMEGSVVGAVYSTQEYPFYLHDGTPLYSLQELHDLLPTLSYEEFNHFVNAEKNDFAVWVRNVFSDHALAERLESAANPHDMVDSIAHAIEQREFWHTKMP